MYVFPLLGHHLGPLNLGNAAEGIEHADTDPWHILKAHQGGLSGVAGGGGENTDFLGDALFLLRGGEQLGQHTQRHILKGRGGAPEELQYLKISNGNRRCQVLGLEFTGVGPFYESIHIGNIRQQGRENGGRHLLGGKSQAVLPIKCRNGPRHIQSAVRCQTGQYSLGAVDSRGLPPGGNIIHKVPSYRLNCTKSPESE